MPILQRFPGHSRCAGNLYAGILGYNNCPLSFHSIQDGYKKHIIDLESFRNILHICPRVHGQPFAKPPFEEEILAFIHFLGHSAAIRTLTDVNINKLYQPWRSFAALINKCLTGTSSGYDSLRLSQAQILPSGSGADERTGSKPGVPDVPTDESEEELSWNSTNDEGDDNEEQDDDSDEKDASDDGGEGNGDDDDEDNDGEE
nr:hypothetical protein [Tanacetum cinerariifolium]